MRERRGLYAWLRDGVYGIMIEVAGRDELSVAGVIIVIMTFLGTRERRRRCYRDDV